MFHSLGIDCRSLTDIVPGKEAAMFGGLGQGLRGVSTHALDGIKSRHQLAVDDPEP